MIDSADLVGIAQQLSRDTPAGAPSAASLRRALSTAYYALFHRILQEGADRLAGGTSEAQASIAWLLAYRAFNHGAMARRCAQLIRPPAPLSTSDFSPEARAVATEFRNLQDDRHRADYDPRAVFAPESVQARVQAASDAIRRFDDLPEPEARLFVTFLLLGVRDATG